MTTAKSYPDEFVQSHREVLEAVPDPQLRTILADFGRSLAKREQEEQAQEPAKQLPAKVIQFPLFPEAKRPVSNDVARSALFSCVQGKDLARWLHLYLATHAAPFPVSVEFIRRESGSRTAALREFRRMLRYALDDLKANGDIAAWEIDDNDLVNVDRGKAISDSQRRHLARPKASRSRKK